MMNLIVIIFLGLFSLLSPTTSLSFDNNPVDVDCWGKDYLCALTKRSEKFKFPVHETMTLLAWDCYGKPETCRGGCANTAAATLKRTDRLRDLELGSEWNDDPDSLLRQGITEAKQWYSLFKDAKLQSVCKKQPCPQCDGVKIIQDPMMLYRSHFGDLQFLHSMASADNEPAEVTKGKMMVWAEFTYKVFVDGKIIDEQYISTNSKVAEILNKPGWTVGALFNPVPGGEWKKSFNPLRYGKYVSYNKPRQQNKGDDISVRHIALGSLLHMIQDSYTESHTARENGCEPSARYKKRITAFRNYTGQQGDDHAIADKYPAWLGSGDLSMDNPVWATAQLIQFAYNKEAWEKVKIFLDENVLLLSNPQAKPEPGNKDCFEGKSSKVGLR